MLYENYPELLSVKDDIEQVIALLIDCFSHGGKLMCAGKGGSAADAVFERADGNAAALRHGNARQRAVYEHGGKCICAVHKYAF